MSLYEFHILSEEEIIDTLTGYDFITSNDLRTAKAVTVVDKLNCVNIPRNKNWLEDGKVTPVTVQQCNDAWVHAAVSTLESQIAIKNSSDPKKLSLQYFEECINPKCDSGHPSTLWNYVKKTGGAVLEESYNPYNVRHMEACRTDLPKAPNSQIDSWVKLTPGDEELLKCSIAINGPHFVSVNMIPMISYEQGIFNDPLRMCGKVNSNHALTLVGNYFTHFKN